MNFNKPQDLENKKIEEIKTPENKIKEGVDFVFEQNPELVEIGTKEQYSEYLDTVFPESKLKDIVYHGTKHNEVLEKGFYKKDDNLPLNKRAIYFAPDFEFSKGFGWQDSNKVLATIINLKNPFMSESLTKEQEIELINSYKEQLLNSQFAKYSDEWSYRIVEALKEKDWTAFGDQYSKILNNYFSKYKHDGWIETEGWVGDSKRENKTVLEPDQIHILGSKQDLEKFKEFVSKDK